MIFRRRNEPKESTAVIEQAPPALADDELDALLAEIDSLQAGGSSDSETTRRLLRLRHQAGVRLVESAPPAGHYPAPSADLPVAADGRLPDFAPGDLTPELLRGAILRDGCAIVRGMIERDRAAELGQELRELFAWRDDPQGSAADRDLSYEEFVPDPPHTLIERPWVNGAGGIWLADSPRLMSEVLHLYEEVGLRRLITGYLGERPAFSVNKSTLRRARTSVSSIDWHQDGAFMGDVRTLNVWLSLSDCGETAPGLYMVPRRIEEIVQTGTPGAQFDWSVSPTVAEQVAGPAGTVRPIFQPGDAVLFDNFFLHATWVHDQMPEMRFALESWFFSPSRFPKEYVPLVF